MYKPYSDSYLMSLTKVQIIELLRVAEHNFFATEEALNNSTKVGMEIAEKYDRVKELLKLAVKQMAEVGDVCDCICSKNCPLDECGKFTFHDEIMKFINN